ncbi:MAG: MlaD family protein [Rubrivivax sp.]|nr:MlaD family protein [Rubrivivax sp.]
METKVNYALVGAFVLSLGAALIAGALWLASGGAWQKKVDLYLAIVDESVAGLNINAPVKFNGVDVGQVQDIQLDGRNPERVRLLFAIEHGTPIKNDTLAVLKTQGLTGIAYVELSGGAPDAAPLAMTAGEAYPVITTQPSLSARLENVLTGVLSKLDRTSGTIDAVLSEANRAAFTSALADIATVTRTLAARKDTMDQGLVSAARTFDQAARVATQAGPVLERVGRGADALETMGKETALASQQASQTVAAVGADLQRFSAEALPELQRLMGELSTLSASLRRLSEQTERSPSSLLLGRGATPDGPGETSRRPLAAPAPGEGPKGAR